MARNGSCPSGIPQALATRIDERGKISAMELKPNGVEVAWERRGDEFLRRGGGASEGGAEGAGASATTRRRDRPKPVCDWQDAGGGGRSGDASQGQTEVRMAWADAMPRPEQLGVLRPSAGGGDDDGARDAERLSEEEERSDDDEGIVIAGGEGDRQWGGTNPFPRL